ncbi:MAG: chloride channel protein, partial [Deltaproteobacteria bacterium]|nr:chloride channel protein [Deltaproteobacteria bacterium]
VGCGAAGAIAGIFNAPVAGMVFAVEVILGDWTAGELLSVGLAAALGAEASRLIYGEGALFHVRIAHFGLFDLLAAPFFGVYLALVSIMFSRMLHGVTKHFLRFSNPMFRAALGGLLVGFIIVLIPEVRGEGYHLVQKCIDSKLAAGMGMLLIALLGKLVATSLTLGSGGIGGIFAPCLVMGSLAGAFFGRVLAVFLPGQEIAGEGAYALLGMTGLLSGVLQAPLTGIFLIAEVTGGYHAMVQLIIVGMIASLATRVVEKRSVYESGIGASGQIPRPRTDERILSEIDVMEVLETDCLKVPPEMTIRKFVEIVQQSTRNYFIVEDPLKGKFLGLVKLESVRHFLLDPALQDSVLVEELMETRIPMFRPDADLVEILSTMERTGAWSVPVVENDRFLGLVSRATVLDHYRRELIAQSPST